MNTTYNIPVWKKYTLSIEEAAAYFRIGEHKLRNLINENKNADYLLWNGNRVQIKSMWIVWKLFKRKGNRAFGINYCQN